MAARLPIPLAEILLLVVFAYISLVPFYYLQPLQLSATLPAFSLPKYLPFLIILVLAASWLTDIWRRRRPIAGTSADPFFVAYLGISLGSLVNAPYPVIGLVKWGYYHTTGALLCFLVVQYLTTWAAVRRFTFGLCAIGGVVVVYTLCSTLFGRDLLWDGFQRQYNPKFTPTRVTGPFGNPTSTATYLMLLLPLPCWLSVAADALSRRILYLILGALFLLTIVLTQTRGALLAALVVLVILVPLLGRLGSALPKNLRRWLLLLLSLMTVGGSAVAVYHAPAGGEQYLAAKARWEALFSPGMLAYTERYRIAQYRTTANVLGDHPLLGTGFGNFTRVFTTYRDTSNYLVAEFPEHTTDNMYLMVAAETGYLGLAVSLSLLGTLFFAIFNAYRQARNAPPGMLLQALFAGGIGFLVNMATWDALNDPTVRMTFWLLIGVALSLVRIQRSGSDYDSP